MTSGVLHECLSCLAKRSGTCFVIVVVVVATQWWPVAITVTPPQISSRNTNLCWIQEQEQERAKMSWGTELWVSQVVDKTVCTVVEQSSNSSCFAWVNLGPSVTLSLLPDRLSWNGTLAARQWWWITQFVSNLFSICSHLALQQHIFPSFCMNISHFFFLWPNLGQRQFPTIVIQSVISVFERMKEFHVCSTFCKTTLFSGAIRKFGLVQ